MDRKGKVMTTEVSMETILTMPHELTYWVGGMRGVPVLLLLSSEFHSYKFLNSYFILTCLSLVKGLTLPEIMCHKEQG